MNGPGPIVIKLGGSILEDPASRRIALGSIADAWRAGESVVLVHGGGRKIDSMLAALGIPKQTHRGLRITDEPTLEVVVGVLAGIVNKCLVGELAAAGVPAAGISGADGATLTADLHPAIDGVTLGRVGRVTGANPTLIQAIAGRGMLPVVGSVALGRGGQLLNVNADAAASAVAVGLGARQLVYLTDVDGLLDERGALIPSISADSARMLVEYSIVKGGMLPKLQSAVDAVAGGVGKVVIAGPRYHAEILQGTGGTHLVAA
ncbi:MAG TPA: acetylglutamate kinase [Thermoanaerobaculia bacterium]|nr:acetylglutamate kinase [Thermoanaerobaculia bacterium]